MMGFKFKHLILVALICSCGEPNSASELRNKMTSDTSSDLTVEDFFDLPSIKDVQFSEDQKGFMLQHVYPMYNAYLKQDTKQWCVNFSSKLSATSGGTSRLLHLTRILSKPNPRSYFEYHFVSLVVLDGHEYVVDGTADQFFDHRRGPIFMEKAEYLEFADSLGYEVKNDLPHSTALEMYRAFFPDEQSN